MGIVKVSAAFAAAQCWTREVTFEAVHGWGQFGLSTAGYWEPLVSSLAVVAVDNPWKLSPVVDSGTILAAQEKNSGRGWFQSMVPAVGSAVTKERGGSVNIDASKMDGSPGMSGQGGNVSGELATRLGELARELQHEDDLDTVLSGIVQAAVQLIPGAAEASISLVTGRKRIVSKVASGDLPRRVDALQSSSGQGPCLDAAYDERIVRVPDLSTEARWPAFCSGAVELGERSMLSIQLFVEGDRLGALNLFGARPDAFDLESEQIGLLVAAHAAVAFADSQKISQLNEALITRQLIGQAEGILMERYKISAQQAFLVLTRASSSTGSKLRDVAEHLASSGEIPTQRNLRGPR